MMLEDREVVTFTRKELYDLVWSMPIVQIVKKYGGSDVIFAKRCRKRKIPLPGRGYWRKVECGKKVKRPPLPDSEYEDKLTLHVINEESKAQEKPEEVPEYVTFENNPENKIVVPSKLNKPHPYVAEAKKALESGREDDKYNRVIPSSKPCLNIKVCRDSLDRALRIIDTIIKAFESRNIEFLMHNNTYKASVDGELFTVSIEERLRMDKTGKIGWDGEPEITYLPTGRLTLVVDATYYYGKRKWNDGKKQLVEDCLNEMLIVLYWFSAESKREKIERDKRAKEEAERQRIIQELKEQQRLENEKIERLEFWVSGWNKAQDIRRFVNALADSYKEIHEESEMAQWIRWALQQADRCDPLVESPPSVLDTKV